MGDGRVGVGTIGVVQQEEADEEAEEVAAVLPRMSSM